MADLVRILSFDPGLTYAGWAVGDYDRSTNVLTIVDYGVMEPSKDLDRSIMRPLVEACGRRILSLLKTEEMVSDLYAEFHPDYVCSEDAFFNRFRPMAYAALLEWITSVGLFLWKNYRLRLYTFAPKIIKKIVARGDSGKLDVQKAIRAIPEIVFEESERYTLKEHSADAIACNWTFCCKVLNPQEDTHVAATSKKKKTSSAPTT